MANPSAYSPICMPNTDKIYGPDAVVDPQTGTVSSIGQVTGSIVFELNEGAVHRLNTMVFAIVTAELIGYNVSIYYTPGSVDITKRLPMFSPQAQCTPVNANVAVPTLVAFSESSWLNMGAIGSRNIQGLYTTRTFITDGRNTTKYQTPFSADFWRDYVDNEELISELAFSNLNDSNYFPPDRTYCADGEFGCQDHCQRMYACTLREKEKKECVVIVAAQPTATRYYWPSMISNLNIPAYVCFIGRNALQKYVLDMHAQDKGVLFYLNYPDEFITRYPGMFTRISMPKGTAKEVGMNTGTFGENGYGEPTNNPVKVERFDDSIQKLTSFSLLFDLATNPILGVIGRTRIPDADLESIMNRYIALTSDSSLSKPADPYFESACGWIRANYAVWKTWLVAPLPLCTIQDHMNYLMSNCENESTTREIVFEWKIPDPTNVSKPFACDGGFMELPPPLPTSHSCNWLLENGETWIDWITALPECDEQYYTYEVAGCEADSRREIIYRWLLPRPGNESLSLECVGDLPEMVHIHCDYMPINSTSFAAVSIFVWILIAFLVVSMVLVAKYRHIPVVRRSQFEFLEIMLVGALSVSFSIFAFAGAPTDAGCAMRPVTLSLGFTLVFGSLVVKTLRVYRIFNTKRLKRVVLPSQTMLKYLAGFVAVDVAIFVGWFVVDYPSVATIVDKVEGVVDDVVVLTTVCSSSGFVFSALLIFYKAMLLGLGLYLSFKVRNVSSDFQEAVWIFASSLVVAVASLFLLPFAYLAPLKMSVFYVIFAMVLWIATATVVGLMLIPKFLRHRDLQTSVTNSSDGSSSEDNNPKVKVIEQVDAQSIAESSSTPVQLKRGPRVAPTADVVRAST